MDYGIGNPKSESPSPFIGLRQTIKTQTNKKQCLLIHAQPPPQINSKVDKEEEWEEEHFSLGGLL